MELKILVLPSIHWEYLWQRPQQIVSRLGIDEDKIMYLQKINLDFNGIVFTLKSKPFLVKAGTARVSVVTMFLPPVFAKLKKISDSLGVVFFRLYLWLFDFKPDVAIFYTTQYHFLLSILKAMGTKIVYDCTDEVSGFHDVDDVSKVLSEEKELAINSSIVIATSGGLCRKLSKFNSNCYYIPNGADIQHFLNAANSAEKVSEIEHLKHPIIGFIGAIYEWFDVDLVCRLAELHPEYSILLVGPINYGAEKFKQHLNITILGNRDYKVLPKYLSYMDVCLIPFKINQLTLASNPVKMYEYLAAGKPVVSSALPEVCKNASEIVYIGKDSEDFIRKVEKACSEKQTEAIISKRIQFAKDNSWERRVKSIEAVLKNL